MEITEPRKRDRSAYVFSFGILLVDMTGVPAQRL